MREIKFRGKRVDNGEWVYGFHFMGFTGIPYILVLHDHILGMTEYYEVDPATMGQFTGLLDKNGKEIYEGDIVDVNTTHGTYPLAIKWNYECCGFTFDHNDWVCFDWLPDWNGLEVIGNVHDTPDLLK